MKPPIIVHDSGDVMFFRTVELAERYIEPWAVEQGFQAYDSQGRRLTIKPNGFITAFEVETEPTHADELQEIVVRFLLQLAKRLDISEEWVKHASLEELIQAGVTKCETQ